LNRPISLCILFALRRESAPFLSRLQALSGIAEAPCSAGLFKAGRRRILVLETGIGAERARRAVAWLLDNFTPKLLIAAGFAGALSDTLRVGDVMVASEVVEPEDVTWRVALPAELADLICGRLYTSPELLSTAAAKRVLFEQTGALAADMESGLIAEACVARRVACAAVRSVSDGSDEGLSAELVRLIDGGNVSLWRVLQAIMRRPRLIGELWRLQRSTRTAARNLADALWRLFE
jgi:adenosylhomocysteine nucleosidase